MCIRDRGYSGNAGGFSVSAETKRLVEQEVKRLIDEGYETARNILIEKQEDWERLAQGLLEYETLTGDEIRKVIAGEKLGEGDDAGTPPAPTGGGTASIVAIPKTRKPRAPKPKPDPRPTFDEELAREKEQIEKQKAAQKAAEKAAQKAAEKAARDQRLRAEAEARQLKQLQGEQAAVERGRDEEKYKNSIRLKVRGLIALPPGIQGNPQADFEVTQLPSGDVLDVKLRRSSGNPALDAAVERAIRKASPLPKPPYPELFNRVLNIPYRPRDE